MAKGPLRSEKIPEMILPNVFDNEYIPTARPAKNGPAPSEMAKGLIMGNWANKSKNAKKMIR